MENELRLIKIKTQKEMNENQDMLMPHEAITANHLTVANEVKKINHNRKKTLVD